MPKGKLEDKYGWRAHLTPVSIRAIKRVDNETRPSPRIKDRKLRQRIEKEYKRRLVLEVEGFIKQSPKRGRSVARKYGVSRRKGRKTRKLRHSLKELSWKKLQNLRNALLHPRSVRKTRKSRRSPSRRSSRRNRQR
jgi:hypothetical protein